LTDELTGNIQIEEILEEFWNNPIHRIIMERLNDV